jgi:hypothetical protein
VELRDPDAEFEKRFKHFLITASPVYCVVVTRDHKIKDIDHRLANKLGYYRPTELTGKDFGMFLPSDLRERHPGYVRQFFEDSRPRPLVSRSGRLFQLIGYAKNEDSAPIYDCFVTLAAYETAQCDGLCLKFYPDNEQLAVAFVMFLDDFGTLGEDIRRAALINRHNLQEAVDGMVTAASKANTKPDIDPLLAALEAVE